MLPVCLTLLKIHLVEALRRVSSLFYQGTVLSKQATLAVQFGDRMRGWPVAPCQSRDLPSGLADRITNWLSWILDIHIRITHFK
jgi:hypothetical protein